MTTSSSKPKVLLSRKTPSKLLSQAAERGEIELVAWPDEQRAADGKWLLENVRGAQGAVVMLADKVRSSSDGCRDDAVQC